jgi:hypothetical protein
MRKSVGVIEPTKDVKAKIALLSLDIGKKRSHNVQTKDASGKRNSSKDTKLSNKLRSKFVTPEPARREPAMRNPKKATYAPLTKPRIADTFSDRPNTRH